MSAFAVIGPAVIAAASKWPFVIASWLAAAVIIGLYAASLVRKGRRLSQDVPPESRRWM